MAVAADPAFALGELELRKKQIIARLQKEGLLEVNKRLFIPVLPQRIGLIASKGSAGYNDILKTFKTSSFGFKIFLADASNRETRLKYPFWRHLIHLKG